MRISTIWNIFNKLIEKVKLFVEILFYVTIMSLLIFFINQSVQLQVKNKRIKFFQTFLTYLCICLFMQIKVHFFLHVIALKLFGRDDFNRKTKNVKAVNYIISIFYVLLISMLFYATGYIGMRYELNTEWNLKSVLKLSSLLIGTSICIIMYLFYYSKHFTVTSKKPISQDLINEFMTEGIYVSQV